MRSWAAPGRGSRLCASERAGRWPTDTPAAARTHHGDICASGAAAAKSGRGVDHGGRQQMPSHPSSAGRARPGGVPRPVSGGHTCSLPHSAGSVPSCRPGQRCWPPGAFVRRDSELAPAAAAGGLSSSDSCPPLRYLLSQTRVPGPPVPSRCHPSCPRRPDSRDAVMLLEKAGRCSPPPVRGIDEQRLRRGQVLSLVSPGKPKIQQACITRQECLQRDPIGAGCALGLAHTA